MKSAVFKHYPSITSVTTLAIIAAMLMSIYPYSATAAASGTWDFSNPVEYISSATTTLSVATGTASLSHIFIVADIPGDTGYSFGAVALDANDDGFDDIYVANYDEQNRLWLNNGDGTWMNADIPGDTGTSQGVATLDANDDGFDDIYVANVGEQNKLWLNDGTGNFTASDIAGDLGQSYGVIILDINADGYEDIYVTNLNEQNRLWLNNGDGTWANADITGDTNNSFDAVILDANADGNMDIYVSNYGKSGVQNNLWLNNGDGTWANADILGDIGLSQGVVTLDADSDGFDDIYVANVGEQNKLWLNDGTGNFTASDIAGDLGQSYGVIILDINADGYEDIYVTNLNEQNRLWLNNGDGTWMNADIPGDTDISADATALDANGDGFDDIYVANVGEQNKLYLNTFSTTTPYITPTIPLTFTGGLNTFTETLGASTTGSVSYQISIDNGTTWFYWNTSAWATTTATDGTETSPASDINTNLSTFATAGGDFLWRAFLVSNGSQPVVLEEVTVSYVPPPEPARRSSGSSATSIPKRVVALERENRPEAAEQLREQYPDIVNTEPLQARIKQLQAQLEALRTLVKSSSPTTLPVRDLYYGLEGEDVKTLQTLLINHNAGPKAATLAQITATGGFYSYTKAALIEYQTLNNISPAAGYFGPLTRVQMKRGGLGWW